MLSLSLSLSIYIYIYIYIYIVTVLVVTNSLCGFVANRVRYILERAQTCFNLPRVSISSRLLCSMFKNRFFVKIILLFIAFPLWAK